MCVYAIVCCDAFAVCSHRVRRLICCYLLPTTRTQPPNLLRSPPVADTMRTYHIEYIHITQTVLVVVVVVAGDARESGRRRNVDGITWREHRAHTQTAYERRASARWLHTRVRYVFQSRTPLLAAVSANRVYEPTHIATNQRRFTHTLRQPQQQQHGDNSKDIHPEHIESHLNVMRRLA